MKNMSRTLLLVSLLFVSADAVSAQMNATEGFNRLKALAGEWEGDGGPNESSITISYEIVSGGEAVIETRAPLNEPTMVTVFHLDGDSLMLTHYCAAGNQPRMRAVALTDEIMDFNFVDVTNLSEPAEGHMRGLTFHFDSEDTMRQVWTWHQGGEDTSSSFVLKRKD